MKNEINYLAIAKTGDIPGMAGPDKTITFRITTKDELKIWRTFNRVNRLYRLALGNWTAAVLSGENDEVKSRLNSACHVIRQKVFIPAALKLRAHLGGEDVWSKYHINTTWICRKGY
tara:strand:+ start:315 stop:665 length:351 start_codon:yes stop_codon:yes gene_type:complete